MKKRSLTAIILLLAAMLSLFSCTEKQDGTSGATTTSPLPDEDIINTVSDGIYQYAIYETYVEITAYYGSSAMVIVPPDYEGVEVKSIGDSAFYGNTAIRDVLLPDSVVNIANKAFAKCESLEKIQMNNVRATGLYAFEGTSLTELTMPTMFANLGKYSFYGTDVKSVTYSENFEGSDGYAFAECKSLEEVTLTSAVKMLPDRTFSGCTALIEVEIPSSVAEIKDYVFAGCTALEKITIPSSCAKIGNGVFSGSPNVVIHTTKGSAAEKYAIENGIAYVLD